MENNKNYYISITRFNNVCRICLKGSNEMTSIHDKQNILQLSISEMIKICTDLTMEENEFIPRLVCSKCKEELIQVTKFRFKFNKSCKLLNQYMANIVSKKVDPNRMIIINSVRNNCESFNNIMCKEENNEQKPIIKTENMYKCSKCGEGFSSKIDRAHHQRVFKHYLKKTVICSKCNMDIPVQNYKIHFLKHSVALQCKLCNKAFSNNFNLQRHMNTHSNLKPYSCNICNEKFARQDKLKTHARLHTDIWCSTCKKFFESNQMYREHLNVQRRCIEKYRRTLSCDTCLKKFTLPKSLEIHKLLHTDQRVICPQCGNSYPNEEKLNNHIQLVHCKREDKSKEFLCNICAKQYSSKIILQRHILTHLGLAKKFYCEVCEKSFTQAHSLRLHLKIHTGEKSYICHICSQGFNKPFNLNRHLKMHNNIRPHMCSICTKSFRCKQSLLIHVRTHTGEKPFACSFCSKTFTERNSMIKHSRIHIKDSLM